MGKNNMKYAIINVFYYFCEKFGQITGLIHAIIINYYSDYKNIGNTGVEKFTTNYNKYIEKWDSDENEVS